jgi:hypothetical protein
VLANAAPLSYRSARDLAAALEAREFSAVELRRARGERRPLLGVPMTAKESYNVASADHVGLAAVQRLARDGGCARGHPAQERGRGVRRKDERPGRPRRLAVVPLTRRFFLHRFVTTEAE